MNEHINSVSCESPASQSTPEGPTYRQIQETIRRDPAFDVILEKLYRHLRAIAANIRRSHRFATLRTTELVHEAAMKMMKAQSLEWQDEAHFQRIAAVAMKQIMIDSARRRNAKINGGGLTRAPLDEWLDVTVAWDDSMLDLGRALDKLGESHSREAQVVDLHFFGGLTIPETAAALQVSVSTVTGDFRFARSFLSTQIGACTPVEAPSQEKPVRKARIGQGSAPKTLKSAKVAR